MIRFRVDDTTYRIVQDGSTVRLEGPDTSVRIGEGRLESSCLWVDRGDFFVAGCGSLHEGSVEEFSFCPYCSRTIVVGQRRSLTLTGEKPGETLRAFIRTIREEDRSWSIERLADRMDRTRQTIWHLENADGPIEVQTFVNAVEGLDGQLHVLVDLAEDPEPEG